MSTLTVATFNIYNRMGRWEERAPLVVEQLVKLAPDAIGLQEIDLMLDQGSWLARQVNDVRKAQVPYEIRHAASPGFLAAYHGIATMSRMECLEHEVLDLMTFGRTAQRLALSKDGRKFIFVNTHLHHPPEATEERVRQAEHLLDWLDRDARRLPTIIVGDFNAYVEEPTVALMKSRFRSAYEAVHGAEPAKTWPTPVNTHDPSPAGTLDYIYVTPEFAIEDAGLAFDVPAARDPELFPSDHLGLYARLAL